MEIGNQGTLDGWGILSPVSIYIQFQFEMREGTREGRCQVHNQPWTKIEALSRKLLCQKCLSENEQERRQRLQLQRLRLHKNYQIQLSELVNAKRQTDRLSEILQNKNMSEAKKLINKASPEVQKIVETLLERELSEANRILKAKAENELQAWKHLDGKTFSTSYLEFESAIPAIEERLEALKGELKQKIAQQMKLEIRAFYSALFEM